MKRAVVGIALVAVGALVAVLWSMSDRAHGVGTRSGRVLPGSMDDTTAPASRAPGVPVTAIPFRAESEPAGAALGDEPPVNIRVVDADKHPVVDAEVVIVVLGDELWDRRRTDKNGVARCRSRDRSADVVVLASGYPPHESYIDINPGDREIELPRGAEVSGVVTVDGAVPREPVTLFVRHGFKSEVIDRLPTEVRAGERQVRPLSSQVRIVTGPGGAFALRGLDEGWTGEIGWDLCFDAVAEGLQAHRPISVHAPATGVRVDLATVPMLTGRVVAADGSGPVAGANVMLRAESPARVETSASSLTAADGRFSFGLHRELKPADLHVEIRAASSTNDGSTLHRFDGDFSHARDVGDLALAAVRVVKVALVSPDGAPVTLAAVAVAEYESPGPVRQLKTGEDGTVDVVCAEGIMAFDVKARGFDPLHAYIKPSTPSPLVVRLTRGQWLDITAAGDGGDALTGCFVVVAFETPQPRSGGSKIYMSGMTGFDQPVAVREQADIYQVSGGHLLIGELPVSEPVTVSLVDAAACTIMSESLSLARGETRDVKLHTGRRARTLSVAVRDGNGKPISDAMVSFGPHVTAGHGGRHGELFRTRGAGVIRPVYGDETDVLVQARGHAALALRGYRLPPEGTPAVFVIESPRSVVVTVADAGGTTIPVPRLTVSVSGNPLTDCVHTDTPGVFVLHPVPTGTIDLATTIDRTTHRTSIDTSKPTATFVLPAQGSLDVSWTVDLTGKRDMIVLLEAIAPAAGETAAGATAKPGRDIHFWQVTSASPPGAHFNVPLLPAGDYRVTLVPRNAPQGEPGLARPATVTIVAHQTASVTLTP